MKRAMTCHCNKPGCEKTWPRDPVLEVACPDCAAPIGSPCKRPSGWKAMTPHTARDLLADELGHYGPCPLGQCGIALSAKVAASGGYKSETVKGGGEQFVLPGCERAAKPDKDDRQGSLL